MRQLEDSIACENPASTNASSSNGSSRFLSLWFFSVLQVLGGGKKGYICESQVDIIIPLQLALV